MLKKTAKIGFHTGRYLLWLAVSLFVLLLLVAVLLVSLDAEYYKRLLVEQVQSATGRQLVIEGGMEFRFSPLPTFYANQVRLANAEWGTRPWMFSARRVEIHVDPAALLKQELRLSDILVFQPHFWFEKNDAGLVNWDMRKSRPDPAVSKPKVALGWLFVKELEASDGKVEYPQWGKERLIDFSRLKVKVDEITRLAKIRLQGAMDERSLEAWGTLDSFATVVNRQPSSMKLKVRYGESQVIGEGTAQELLSWEGANIDFDLQLDSLSDLSPLLPVKLPPVGPLAGSARIEQPGNWRTMQIKDIDVVSRHSGLKARLGGTWAGPDAPAETGLQLAAKGDLAAVLGNVNWESETGLEIDVDLRLQRSSEGYRLALNQLELQGEGLVLRSSEVAKDLVAGEEAEIPVEAEIESLQKVGAVFGIELPEWGPISGTARLANREGRVALEQIQVQITGDPLQAKAEGRVDDLLKRSGGELTVTASAPELKKFEAFKGIKITLPPLTSLQLEGAIHLDQGQLRGEVKQLTGGAKGVALNLSGPIGDLARFGDVQLQASGKAGSLLHLNPLFDIKLPAFGPLDVEGRLVREGVGAFDFRDVHATIREKDTRMELSGALHGVGPKMESRFEVKLDAEKLDRFSELVKLELPDEGPMKASAQVLAADPRSWRLVQLQAKLENADGIVTVTGGVDSLFRFWLPDLSIQLQGLTTSKLASLVKREIPLSGVVNATARATRAKDKPIVLQDIQANLGGDGLQAAVSGNLRQLAPFAGLELDAVVRADNTHRIGWLKDFGLEPVGPVHADFRLFSEEGGKGYRADVSRATIRNSDAKGAVVWRSASRQGEGGGSARSRLDIQITSEVLDLKSLLPKKPERKGGLFDPTPLKTAWIHKQDGTWDFRIDRFRDEVVEATDVDARMTLKDGQLEISKMNAKLGSGDARLTLALDANRQPYPMRLNLFTKNADPARLTKARESDLFISGAMDLDIELSGAGNSIAGFMANANGKIVSEFRNTKIRMENLDLFGADIFTSLISVINPPARRSDIANVECAVLKFPVDKGKIVAKRSIAVKTDKLTLLGGGEIDLADESLNLVVAPKAREGFGISAGTLAKMVGIAGTITSPKVDTRLKGYLETGVVIGAAIATSGLTLLAQGLWDRTTANSDICELVLGNRAKPEVSEREIVPDDSEKR